MHFIVIVLRALEYHCNDWVILEALKAMVHNNLT